MTSLGRLFRTRGSRNKTEDTEKEMGFFEHLEEFRAMLVRCIGAFALSMILTFCFLKPIFAFMRGPLDQALARNPKPPAPDGTGADPIELVSALTNILLNGKLPTATHAAVSDSATATAATGASAIDALTTATQATAAGGPMVVMKFMDIFSIIMNIGLIGAIVLSGPCILWFGSRFIAPALTEGEKKCIIPFCVGSTLLFISGGVFSFFWLIPTSIQVMFHFVRMFGLTMPWLASDYYNFVTIMVLLVGLAF
ncbi:MAG: twin-arginine translocase subunit TatC, partial [Puniceicoccales bacterium]|nr:twin-arginine translocase subunit TatC [Puniceicoccales bacterium]